MLTISEFFQRFCSPSNEYRSLPFWSWNDKLEPEILKEQIKAMSQAGLGGYFMHSRGGLETEYLKDEWMNCIKTCIEEGDLFGLKSWCYDEDGWPSGFAGGKVPSISPDFHVQWIELERIVNFNDDIFNNAMGVYRVDIDGFHTRIYDFAIIEETVEYMYFAIYQKSNPSYIDILNPNVIKSFLDITHEQYFNNFGDYLGNSLPGFFTDEPQYSSSGLPWSTILSISFKNKYGYDIVDVVIALFMDCNGYEKIRYEFWSLVNELYTKSFGEQIMLWCESHNCSLTGHQMAEETLFSQMRYNAGVMSFYEYMHIPGIDWLGRFINSPILPKQASSVANQLGKKFVISEMFALCGWDVSFQELKWIAEWQYVNGINLMCQHLESYSIRGSRKRDYPPSLFYQQSWWKEYKGFNDYFARLSVILSEGKNKPDILVIHPINSAWIAYNYNYTDTLKKLEDCFSWLSQTLSDFHFEYHFGDETIISKYGKIENNKFIVGDTKYSAVILPSLITIDSNTLKLLNKYTENGGKLFYIDQFPQLVNGIPLNELSALKETAIKIEKSALVLKNTLFEFDINNLSIKQNDLEISDIHCRVVDYDTFKIYFFVNHSQKTKYKSKIKLSGQGYVLKLNLENGVYSLITSNYSNGQFSFDLDFAEMESHVILVGETSEFYKKVYEFKDVEHIDVTPQQNWVIDEADLNSLTLDCCEYNIDGIGWNRAIPVFKLMDKLLNSQRNCTIAMRFEFDLQRTPQSLNEFYLVMEKAETFKIFVNGFKIEYIDIGWWKDISFKKVNIKELVKFGINQIVIEGNFFQNPNVYRILFDSNVLKNEKNKLTYNTELENIYLIGEFGVISKKPFIEEERRALITDGPFQIVDCPLNISSGQLTQQGFVFFAGKIKISQNFELFNHFGKRVYFYLRKFDAAVINLFINDLEVKTLMWQPIKIDITEFVHEGVNKLSLQLFAGNRNLLGPHHHKNGEIYYVGPSSFTDKPGWTDGEETEIWSDKYCFVRFGI